MTAKLIECLLKRIGGSKVDLDGAQYHFQPATGEHTDPHVALVDNTDHITILLGIPEGYALASDEATAPVRGLNADLPKLDLMATLSDGAIADQYTRVFGAKPAKGLTRDLMISALRSAPSNDTAHTVKKLLRSAVTAETGTKPRAQRAIKAATAVAAPVNTGSAYDAMSDDELLAEYIVVFGAEPAADMDREAMTEALNAIPKE